jgi:hypothetical protein
MAESEQAGTLRSRRALLTAAAGGAAALAVSAIRPAAVAAAPANMQTETNNATIAPTGVTNSTSGSQALFGHAAVDGNGVEGASVIGIGVNGVSTDTSDPESNLSNAGVVGVAGDAGNTAANKSLTGVYGYSDPSPVDGFVGAGVWGDSADFGVIGSGSVGAYGQGGLGVLGFTTASDGIGVYAAVDIASALALRVEGRAEFTRSGRATVSAGAKKKTVTLAGCTSSTLVFAVLASNRTGRYVRAVVPGSGSFVIYLNADVASNSTVAWIAFTNPTNHSG